MIKKEIDRNFVWHPYASVRTPPPVCGAETSNGAEILLEDGTKLIDGISSWWCAALGHHPEKVVRAIREQAEKMPHVMFAGFTHEPATLLTERLKKILPASLDKFFYADSGSIAVECALKMALQYQNAMGRPERQRIAALSGGYHGDTIGAMSVSDPGGMHRIFRGLLPSQLFLPRPECSFGGEWKDSYFEEMESLLRKHAREVAAVIAEPVFQGANAMWFYHPEYLRKLRTLCDELDIVLIFDEIATGFWRTGRRFASEYAGVVPDVLCIGKALTAGCITLACAVASARIAEPIPVFLHGPTFMANPIACAAAAASVELLSDDRWGQETSRIEAILKQLLAPCRDLANVRSVRVLGAVGVLETERIPDPETVLSTARETGVWLRPYDHFIYTMPPFVTTDEQLERIAGAMARLARN